MSDYVRRDNLLIYQGDDRPFTWDLRDTEGDPLDTDGYKVIAQVRARESSPVVLHEWSTELGNAVITASTVLLKVDDSETWAWRTGVYDLHLTAPNGSTEVVAAGSVYVLPGVTRPVLEGNTP